MQPTAPAAAPITSNTNMPFGGFGQAASDANSAAGILNFLPQQQAQTAKVNPSDTSILPTVNANYSIVNAPTAPTINPASFGSNEAAYNTATQKAMSGLTGSENNAYGQAMQQYQQNMNQFGNLTGVYQNLANTYGLPGYQQDVNTLQNLLQNLNQDVNAQTTLGGGLMTQSARDERYANEANPLNLALSSASRAYETGQTNVNNLLGAYEQSLTNALKPEEMNIANLPTLFQQTNEAAQSGYGQGATTIQNQISNNIEQQRLQAEQEQNKLYAQQIKSEYGNGNPNNLSNIFSTGNTTGSQLQGVTFKNAQAGGSAGYNFAVDGKPASAVSWAARNGQNPSTVIAYMAQNGDAIAGQAYQDLLFNPNMSLSDLAQKYPSLAWGIGQGQQQSQSGKAANLTASNNPFSNFDFSMFNPGAISL